MRLQKHCEQTIRGEQAGFRPGRGCCDQIFALRQLMEEQICCRQRMVIDFIPLIALNWPPCDVCLRKSLLFCIRYTMASSLVWIRNDVSKEFNIKTGVCQGLSPPLQRNYWHHHVTGFQRLKVYNLTPTNSSISCSPTTVRFFRQWWCQGYEHPVGHCLLSLMASRSMRTKWKFLQRMARRPVSWRPSDQTSSRVEIPWLTGENKVASTGESQHWIRFVASVFASPPWCIWKKPNISLRAKIHLYATLILLILLYGSETWTILKQDLNKLEVFQMRCLWCNDLHTGDFMRRPEEDIVKTNWRRPESLMPQPWSSQGQCHGP